MNSGHVIATGGATVLLTDALMYLTHWPLQAMDQTSAGAFAGLIVLGVGGLVAWAQSRAKAPKAPAVPLDKP